MSPKIRRLCCAILAAAAMTFDASFASSQPAAPAPASAPALTPPKVTAFVAAERPAGGGDEGVTIQLDLTIAGDGTLTDATIVTSGGEGFDRAALAAVRKFTFTPARRGDKAVPARIRYRYVFEPIVAPGTAATLPAAPGDADRPNADGATSVPAPGRLEGKVLLRTTGQPVPGVEIALLSVDGAELRRDVSGEDGGFRFAEVAPGPYRVHAEAADLAPFDQAETVAAGELTSLTYRMDVAKARASGEFGATASIEAPPREVTKRTLKAEELVRAAGTRGDPLRAIELLPGVARPPRANGFIIIRGASPADSQVLFEGAPV